VPFSDNLKKSHEFSGKSRETCEKLRISKKTIGIAENPRPRILGFPKGLILGFSLQFSAENAENLNYRLLPKKTVKSQEWQKSYRHAFIGR